MTSEPLRLPTAPPPPVPAQPGHGPPVPPLPPAPVYPPQPSFGIPPGYGPPPSGWPPGYGAPSAYPPPGYPGAPPGYGPPPGYGAPPPGWPSHGLPAHGLGPIPPGLNRWNWGAFLLHWIWGLGNNTPIALLTWVPFGIFVMPFVLGAKGSAWAWQNDRWQSPEHFRRVQRLWAVWGLVAYGIVFGLVGAGIGAGFYALKTSDAYRLAAARVIDSPKAQAALGSPITAGWPNGNVDTSGDRGAATLTFSASGPKRSGSVAASLSRSGGAWLLTRMTLTPEGSEDGLDLLDERGAGLGSPKAGTGPG